MSTLRVGLIGTGFMGRTHAEGWAACPDARLTAVAGPPGRAPTEFTEVHGGRPCAEPGELLEHVDVVDICAPTHLHHDLTLAAAAAGKDVICEKPLARTAEQAERMVAACREAGVALLPAHVVRFFGEYAAAQRTVASGGLGRPGVVRLSRATFQPAKAADNWYLDEAKSGGLVHDLMVHDFDYARWIAGEVATVYARGLRAARPGARGDHVLALLRHRSGAISHIEGSWAHPAPVFRTRGEIAGDAGLLQFDSRDGDPVRVTAARGPAAPEIPAAGSALLESPYTTQVRHFAEVLARGAPPRVTAADGLAAVRIAEAAARSLATGRAESVTEHIN